MVHCFGNIHIIPILVVLIIYAMVQCVKHYFNKYIKGSSKMGCQFPNDEISHCDRCGEYEDSYLYITVDVYGICSNKTRFDDGSTYVCHDCLTEDEYKLLKRLNDFDRGDADCQLGKPHMPGQSKEYDWAYGARYAKQQMDDAKLEPLNKFNEELLGL